jgi:hypothetical protein
MAINFPDSPTLNQQFSAAGRTWIWDGSTWANVGTDIVVADVTDLTASATEINILDGALLSTAELNYVDGVTSAIQTQLNDKANLSGASFTGNISSTGTVSGTAAAATAATAANRVGYMGIPASGAGASGAYTLVEADAGELVYTTSSRTVTIPANASVPFQIGTSIVFISGSGATTTIAINSDTLILAKDGTTGSRTLAAHGMATAVKVAATTWYISGNGLT